MDEVKNLAKAYELRTLCADDVFPMFKIISKIGIKEFKSCFESDDVKEAIKSATNGVENQENLEVIGLGVALEIASVIMANIPQAKEDIYLFLAQVSGMSKDDIRNLPISTFTEMIIDLVKKEEFKDFFGVVSKLFK